MNILGISGFYHDSAACLVVDGRIEAAAQEERFSRIKHDDAFPTQAAAYCLAHAGLTPEQLDVVAFYDKPLAKFDRIVETHLDYAPRGFERFRRSMPPWLRHKLHMRRAITRGLGATPRRLVFLSHHESHAASAFFPSPFASAAILTVDGVGEWATASIGLGTDNRIELLVEQRFPHSLGLLYSAFTAYCGFAVNDGEYKLMGLAPYGEPRYVQAIRDHLVEIAEDGSLLLDMSYFAFGYGDRMFNSKVEALLGGPARKPEQAIDARIMDVARSIQVVTEDAMLAMARHARRLTDARQLVLAGGVALNCVANGRILREAGFEQLWIQPAAGDAGGALGAALFVWHQLLDRAREPAKPDAMSGSLLGPRYAEAEIRALLEAEAAVFRTCEDDKLAATVADLIAEGLVVGHFADRMEFGPRALGARSILADPRRVDMQRVLNEKIKFRESFRPFAPVVLAPHASAYFELEAESPYMLLVAPVASAQRREPGSPATGLARVHQTRSTLPAITHVDDSARIQTVDPIRSPRLYALLEQFHARTGVPVLVNTSFNVRDEPIVNTPKQALTCFMRTNMDALVLERFVLLKAEQPGATTVSGPEPKPPSKRRSTGVDWTPSDAKLRSFGWIATLAFGLLAGALWFGVLAPAPLDVEVRRGVALGSAAVSLGALACSISWPRGNRGLWVVMSALAYPIGWLVSLVSLALVYFGLFTPIGLALRASGRDLLRRRIGRGSASHWLAAAPARPPARYLRQY